jgi:hypothetical protein
LFLNEHLHASDRFNLLFIRHTITSTSSLT